ncbi:MAG: NAD(P)H-quinone oxidoreductase [Gemmatimonadales bacterium]|nr:NAD(P)H-quinone oxidoreductase [Gemmatimonadales bacterium]
MRCATYAGAGGPEVLAFAERPTPEPGAGQVRVRVAASALNRADVLQRRGAYPAPPGWPADIPGLEYAGEVEKLGPGATRWRLGDRVMGLVGGGGHATHVVVHEDEALPVPRALALAEAAAIPEAFLTAWDALVTRGRVAPGERVLLHAVASGVGTAGIQLARLLGAEPLGTSRSADKLARCAPLGLALGIDTRAGGFRERTDGPVHVVIDVLGGGAFAENLAVLAPLGRLVILGWLQGSRADVDLQPILRKRLTVVGSVMRSRSLEERVPLVRAFSAEALPAFDDGRLRPVIGARLPMAELAEAHRLMEADATFGKVVLEW